jgi:uncharacterized phiE125 gp8 family phage protein
MLAPVRTSAPASEPVTLVEAKLHCRVDHTDDDNLINGLISAATGHLDGWSGILGRCLITQSWRQDYDAFADTLRLPLGPAASITSITYYDGDNTQQTLATSVYGLFVDDAGPYVRLKPDQDWPGTYDRPDAVSVTWVCGAATVLPAIKAAILLLIGHWYANREAVNVGNITSELPIAVDALLRPYRAVGV